MNDMLATLKMTLSISSLMGFSVLIGSAVEKIDETTPISVGAACACMTVIVSAAWWLSSRFTKQTRQHAENIKRFRRIEKIVFAIQSKMGIVLPPEDNDNDDD